MVGFCKNLMDEIMSVKKESRKENKSVDGIQREIQISHNSFRA